MEEQDLRKCFNVKEQEEGRGKWNYDMTDKCKWWQSYKGERGQVVDNLKGIEKRKEEIILLIIFDIMCASSNTIRRNILSTIVKMLTAIVT